MIRPKIVTIQTANPPRAWTQEDILRSVVDHPRISRKAMRFYERFLRDESISNRFFGLESLSTLWDESPDEAVVRFQKVAAKTGAEAVVKCLRASDLDAHSIDALVVTTCTGYLCPGLSSYLAESLGLRENVFTLDLTGLGCGAAIPAVQTAASLIEAGRAKRVMAVCIEVCSAALSWGDDIDLILSNCIFADGAAACLLSGEPKEAGYELSQYESLLWPEYRDALRFKNRDSRLCNVIDKSVPMIASKAVKQLSRSLLEKTDGTFDYHAFHPGGRKILDEIETSLGFHDQQMARSRDVLRCFGNMSSPSILFVLKEIFEKDRPQPGEKIMAFSFGAGFTAFGMALKAVEASSGVADELTASLERF